MLSVGPTVGLPLGQAATRFLASWQGPFAQSETQLRSLGVLKGPKPHPAPTVPQSKVTYKFSTEVGLALKEFLGMEFSCPGDTFRQADSRSALVDCHFGRSVSVRAVYFLAGLCYSLKLYAAMPAGCLCLQDVLAAGAPLQNGAYAGYLRP